MKRKNYAKLLAIFLLCIFFAGGTESFAQSKKDREKAKKAVQQADRFFNQKDYRNAINKYAEALVLVPNFAAAHFWKGYAHYYLKEYEQSIIEFDEAITDGFEKPLDIYRLRWYMHYERKDYNAALNDALNIVKLDPRGPNGYFTVGLIYQTQKSYGEAITYYKKSLEFRPDDGDTHYFLAECYFNQGEYLSQGFAALDALKYRTKYVGESYYFVADALYRAKKYDEAIDYYERTINVKPDIYGAYTGLSDIYRMKNRFNDAVETSRKGLQVFPNDAGLYVGLSWYYSLADRHQEAILAAQSAIRLDPNQSMAYTNLCRAFNDSKQYNQAIVACNNALRLSPADGESHLYLARAYEFLKQTDQALANYRKAVEGLVKFTQANPDYSDGFYLLGNAYFALSRDNEAVDAYKRCLQLAPNFARARFTLGYTYLSMGNKQLAREQYNFLRQLDTALAEKLRVAIDGK